MNRHIASKCLMALGLCTVVSTFWGTVNFISPFYSHTYPLAWYGLILFLDGLLWWRWNDGMILRKPREFAVLLFWSAILWFFFEIWNLRLKNWYYAGVSPDGIWPHVEAYLDFATVLPGMFLVYRVLCQLNIPRRVKTRVAIGRGAQKPCILIGFVMLILPLAYPKYCFPMVWGAFIFLLEPICARAGARSLLSDAQKGEWTTFVRLLLAGIICGAYWELCNFWSLAKWIYTVPFFSEGKLFEMPYLGFLGFAPFCVECFVITNAVYLLRQGRHWDPDAPVSLRGASVVQKLVYFLIIVVGLFLSEWSYTRMKENTIDSRAESISEILKDISPDYANVLGKRGWRYPRQILKNWDEATTLIDAPLSDRIYERLQLVSLLQMGSANARLLEKVGIVTIEDLSSQDPDDLYAELVGINKILQYRKTPLVKRRLAAWINAARRQSVLY